MAAGTSTKDAWVKDLQKHFGELLKSTDRETPENIARFAGYIRSARLLTHVSDRVKHLDAIILELNTEVERIEELFRRAGNIVRRHDLIAPPAAEDFSEDFWDQFADNAAVRSRLVTVDDVTRWKRVGGEGGAAGILGVAAGAIAATGAGAPIAIAIGIVAALIAIDTFLREAIVRPATIEMPDVTPSVVKGVAFCYGVDEPIIAGLDKEFKGTSIKKERNNLKLMRLLVKAFEKAVGEEHNLRGGRTLGGTVVFATTAANVAAGRAATARAGAGAGAAPN